MGFLFATIGGNLQITFNNWEKFQPRKDIKSPTWVAVKNDFTINQDFFRFTNDEKLCFIYLLCEASKTNKNGMVIINFDYHSELFKISVDVIKQTIEKLEQNGICTQSVRTRTQSVRTRYVKDRQTDRQTDTHAAIAADLDFEMLYRAYPRKIGKAKAFGVLKKTIKTKDDYDALALAITNYCALVKKENVEPRFIKHFSSFVGSLNNQVWRDYISIENSESKKQTKSYFYENKKITEEEFFELKRKGLV